MANNTNPSTQAIAATSDSTDTAAKAKVKEAQDNAEKAVKLLVENHRLVLTFGGLLVAGLFAFAGRGAFVIDWRFFIAQGCFLLACIAIILAVSASVHQALRGSYNPNHRDMLGSFWAAVLLIAVGLIFSLWIFARASQLPSNPTPRLASELIIENGTVRVAPNTTLKINLQYDEQGHLKSVEVNP